MEVLIYSSICASIHLFIHSVILAEHLLCAGTILAAHDAAQDRVNPKLAILMEQTFSQRSKAKAK